VFHGAFSRAPRNVFNATALGRVYCQVARNSIARSTREGISDACNESLCATHPARAGKNPISKTTGDILQHIYFSLLAGHVLLLERRTMNISASPNNDHLLQWISATLLLTGFALGDAAIIAWCASLVTSWQLIAFVFSYLLIAIGVLFTVWQMSEIGSKRTLHL
jgi:hypothetical protein